ncbi:hypothetical protein J4Q44_G00104930 [Coregonus suidteri]|uniref:C-type lectin domain-containing protein n=1 Tax=Coregonus suidteri TaxID=861788 RepID=A0AAN8RA38_9TELE
MSRFPQKNWMRGSQRNMSGQSEDCLALLKINELQRDHQSTTIVQVIMGVMTVSVLLCVLLTFLGTEVTGTSRPWYHRLSRQVERFARRSEPLSDPYQCPPGFSRPSRDRSTCYHFDNSLKSWSEANTACRQRGGVLASITDITAYEYALSLLDDGYTWVEGSNEQSEFQHKYWLKGAVHDQFGIHEGCLALVKFNDRAGFDDINCSSQANTARTLCEIETPYFVV